MNHMSVNSYFYVGMYRPMIVPTRIYGLETSHTFIVAHRDPSEKCELVGGVHMWRTFRSKGSPHRLYCRFKIVPRIITSGVRLPKIDHRAWDRLACRRVEDAEHYFQRHALFSLGHIAADHVQWKVKRSLGNFRGEEADGRLG